MLEVGESRVGLTDDSSATDIEPGQHGIPGPSHPSSLTTLNSRVT